MYDYDSWSFLCVCAGVHNWLSSQLHMKVRLLHRCHYFTTWCTSHFLTFFFSFHVKTVIVVSWSTAMDAIWWKWFSLKNIVCIWRCWSLDELGDFLFLQTVSGNKESQCLFWMSNLFPVVIGRNQKLSNMTSDATLVWSQFYSFQFTKLHYF